MRNAKDMKSLGSYGTVGLEVVLSVLLGLFIGTKLDEWLGTKPWMAVLWFGFGCAAGGRSVYRSWKSMQAAAKREEAEEGNPAQAFPDDKSLKWRREERLAEEARAEEERRARGEGAAKGEPADGEDDAAALEKGGESATTEEGRQNGASR